MPNKSMGVANMNICIDGVTRPMTEEEEAEYYADRDKVDSEEALSILLGGDTE